MIVLSIMNGLAIMVTVGTIAIQEIKSLSQKQTHVMLNEHCICTHKTRI